MRWEVVDEVIQVEEMEQMEDVERNIGVNIR